MTVAIAAPPTPILKHKDKDRVENNVDDRAEQHGKHCILGTAVHTDHCVQRRRDHGKRQTDRYDIAIILCIRQKRIRRPEERKNGIHQSKKDDQDENAQSRHHDDRIPESLFDALRIAFPELQAQVCRHAVPDQNRKCQCNNGDREYDIRCTVAEISDPHPMKI